MRFKGTLTEWKDDRGFGFIEPAEGGGRVFCHIKAFDMRVRRPVAGDRVTYEVSKDAQGRLTATRVRPVGLEEAQYRSNIRLNREPKSKQSASVAMSPRSFAATYIGIAIFLSSVIWMVVVGRVAYFAPLIYIAMSGITLFAYAIDKSAAMNDRWRITEQSLHLLEVLGGWPGALLAQQWFRHKSRKLSFRIEFWLCAIANVAALVLYAYKSQ